MSTTVTGSPKGPFADAIFQALQADANLYDLVGDRIYVDAPRGTAVTFPYVVLGERTAETNRGAMQLEGVSARVTVHVWSESRGAAQCEAIQSRIRAILQRTTLAVSGHVMVAGSLVCDNELCFPDRDEDMPDRSLYHGVQQFLADLEEAL